MHFNNATISLLCPQSGPVRCGLDTHSRLWHGFVGGPQEASKEVNIHMAPFQIPELNKPILSFPKPSSSQTLLVKALPLKSTLCWKPSSSIWLKPEANKVSWCSSGGF